MKLPVPLTNLSKQTIWIDGTEIAEVLEVEDSVHGPIAVISFKPSSQMHEVRVLNPKDENGDSKIDDLAQVLYTKWLKSP